jgi:hypothetical protein
MPTPYGKDCPTGASARSAPMTRRRLSLATDPKTVTEDADTTDTIVARAAEDLYVWTTARAAVDPDGVIRPSRFLA